MSESYSNQPEIQFVPLSPMEAEVLQRYPDEVKNLGHIAVDGVEIVGVVPPTEAMPTHFVNLSNDPGTRIDVDGDTPRAGENFAKYGSPDAALASLQATEEQEKGTEESLSIAEIAEEAGLTRALRLYEALSDTIQSDKKLIGVDLNKTHEDLQQLHVALINAAESGPWAGNQLHTYPEFLNQLDTITQLLATMAARQESRVAAQQEDIIKYENDFKVADDETQQQLGNSDASRRVIRSLEDARASINRLAADTSGSDAVNMMKYTVDTLTNVRHDPNIAVDDVKYMVAQLIDRLAEAHAEVSRTAIVQEAEDDIQRVSELIKKAAA